MRKEINVYGDVVLLKALEEKVLNSDDGWKNLDSIYMTDYKFIRFYDQECGNVFRCLKKGLNHNEDALIFNLPQDWNQALEALTKKDIPEYIKVTKSDEFVWYKNSIENIFKVADTENLHSYGVEGYAFKINNGDICPYVMTFDCVPSTLEKFEAQNKLKVGDWIKQSDKHWGKISEIKGNYITWIQSCDYYGSCPKGIEENGTSNYKSCKKISDKEVLELFKKEAIKRGLVPGVRYKSPGGKFERNVGKEYNFHPQWISNPKLSCVGDGLCCLWTEKDGWGTVIKDKPIKIGDYEVIFSTDHISIDQNRYYPSELEEVKRVLKLKKIESLNVGCNGQFKLTLDIVEKIIERLNKK